MTKAAIQPLISVIIPTYNRADVVLRAVSSVLKQTYHNIEIIIVDDASEDDTTKVIQQVKKQSKEQRARNFSKIKYIRHKSNLGGSEARNTGIKLAQGAFIAFLDSDDVWLLSKLQLQIAAIAQQQRLENLVCYSQFQKSATVFYQASVLPAKAKQESETIPEYFWLSGGEMLTSTLLISSTLAKTTLFRPGLVKHQDLDFVIRLEQQKAKFIFVPQVLTIWHNEPRCDRISRRVNYQASLNWIEQYRQHISEEAYQGFLLKEIVPKMIKEPAKKKMANKLIFTAWRSGVISTTYSMYLLLKSLLPLQYISQLKKLIKPIKLS